MESSLILAVAQGDIQSSIELLCQGLDPNIRTQTGESLLHLAIRVPDGQCALALVQLLLVHGADVNLIPSDDKKVSTVLHEARKLNHQEIVSLLGSYGATDNNSIKENSYTVKKEADVSTTFHKYIFEDKTQKDKKFNFLEEVANIFEDDLKGVHEVNSRENNSFEEIESEVNLLLSQLKSVGFSKTESQGKNIPTRNQQSTINRNGESTITTTTRDKDFLKPDSFKAKIGYQQDMQRCTSFLNPACNDSTTLMKLHFCSSTPTRREIPKLEVSQVSSIGSRGDSSIASHPKVSWEDEQRNSRKKILSFLDLTMNISASDDNCKQDWVNISLISDKDMVGNPSNLTNERNSKTLVDISKTMSDNSKEMFHSCFSSPGCESNLSFVQEFLVEDRSEGVSLYERRHSSLLGLAGKNTTHMECEVSRNSFNNNSLLTSAALNRTYTISSSEENSSKDLAKEFTKYPSQLKSSLENISVITSKWSELSELEREMSSKFNNISNSAADIVNQLTRETACKASFNYLLLDPSLTKNLPMMVFVKADQELWRTFIESVFYVGKGSRSRPFQHLYEAVKIYKKEPGKKKISDKIKRIHEVWDGGGGVVVVQIFQNTIAVEAFTREAALIDAIGCDNLTNQKPGDYYGPAYQWSDSQKLKLGAFLLFKAFKIFLQDGERQIRPVDLRSK